RIVAFEQALARVYASLERFEEAIAIYRRLVQRTGTTNRTDALNLRTTFAGVLARSGRRDEAIAEARAAVAVAAGDAERLAYRVLARYARADALLHAGRCPDSSAEPGRAKPHVVATSGERSERYAACLQLESAAQTNLGRLNTAVALADRACEITAFRAGEQS